MPFFCCSNLIQHTSLHAPGLVFIVNYPDCTEFNRNMAHKNKDSTAIAIGMAFVDVSDLLEKYYICAQL